MSDKKLLIDHFTFKPTLLEDKRSAGGKMIARGEFARADVATENKRVYPKQLWERECKRLEKRLTERKVYGALDHPSDGRTSLKEVSHIVTDLHMENGVLVGEAEIMDTIQGRNLKAILDAGGAVGVSSRGFGTTRPNNEGMDIVQDDYNLMTFDFVSEPANTTSYPTIHVENKQQEIKPVEKVTMADKLTLESLKKSNPALAEDFSREAEREYDNRMAKIWAQKITATKEETATELKTTFAEQLQKAIADVRSEIEAKVREELLSDPGIAGSKTALESVKELLRPFIVPTDVESVVKEKEVTIESLQKQLADQGKEIEKLSAVAKEAGFRYQLEKLVAGNENAELIRKMVGDVKLYENVEALNTKIVESTEELLKVENKRVERDAEIARLEEENKKLRESVEKVLEATQLLGVQNYIETRLHNHPKAADVRIILEGRMPSTKEQVDEVLAKFREKKQDPGALDEARARVRKMVGSRTIEADLVAEEQGKRSQKSLNESNYNGLPHDLESIRELAGLNEDKN